MNVHQAKEAINKYFSLHVEAYSIWHELTDNGILTIDHVPLMDNETLINVGEDLAEQLHIELYN